MNIKKVLLYIGITLIGIGAIVYITKTIISEKDYKQQLATILEENKTLIKQAQALQESVNKIQIERDSLLVQLQNQQVIIVEKEKQIYDSTGQLITPDSFEELKSNYSLLSSLYIEKSEMYASLLEQYNKDTTLIASLQKSMEDLLAENERLVQLLKKPVPSPFLQHSILGGAGIRYDGTIVLSAGYECTVINKFQVMGLLQYPFQASILIGLKL